MLSLSLATNKSIGLPVATVTTMHFSNNKPRLERCALLIIIIIIIISIKKRQNERQIIRIC